MCDFCYLRTNAKSLYLVKNLCGQFSIQAHALSQTEHIRSLGKRVVVYGSSMIIARVTAWEQVVGGSKTPSLIVDKREILGMVVAIADDYVKAH